MAGLSDLKSLAAAADKAHAKAERLTRQALAAKRDADEARAAFQAKMRELGGQAVTA